MRTAETRATSDEHEQETHELKWQTQRARRPRSRKNTKWCLLSCEFPSEIFAIHTHINTQQLKHTNYTHPIQPQCGHTGKHKQGTLTYIHAKINSIHPTTHTHTHTGLCISVHAQTQSVRGRARERVRKRERKMGGQHQRKILHATSFALPNRKPLCPFSQESLPAAWAKRAQRSVYVCACACVYVCPVSHKLWNSAVAMDHIPFIVEREQQ